MSEQSTHQFIDIEEIKDGVISLKNKNLRSILMVSSINFDLKSSEERRALVASFQRFLNSLDFTLEITIHSRPLDLSEYFSFLREQQDKQDNELLRLQTSEYIDFVKELIKLSNIMAKFFYITVPYNVAVIKKSGLVGSLLPKGKSSEKSKDKNIEKAKGELNLRVGKVISLLAEMSLRAIPLGDKELAELFYGLYNPGVALKQKNLEMLIATGREEKKTI